MLALQVVEDFCLGFFEGFGRGIASYTFVYFLVLCLYIIHYLIFYRVYIYIYIYTYIYMHTYISNMLGLSRNLGSDNIGLGLWEINFAFLLLRHIGQHVVLIFMYYSTYCFRKFAGYHSATVNM